MWYIKSKILSLTIRQAIMLGMNSVLLCSVVYCAVGIVVSQNDTEERECIDNPTGTVRLNVDVRGVPGPQGPKVLQGTAGPSGNAGPKGDRGNKGEKGEIGDSGPTGPKGMLGIKGIKGQEGPAGPRGFPGSDGIRGPSGSTGPPGARGPQGEPGDTVLSQEEFEHVTARVYASVVEKMNSSLLHLEAQNEAMNETIQKCCTEKCGILGSWKRVGFLDTGKGDLCPSALRTVSSTEYNTTACGRKLSRGGCTSIPVPVQISYSKVCGIVKGYQKRSPDAFGREIGGSSSINAPYVDGISITQGKGVQGHTSGRMLREYVKQVIFLHIVVHVQEDPPVKCLLLWEATITAKVGIILADQVVWWPGTIPCGMA